MKRAVVRVGELVGPVRDVRVQVEVMVGQKMLYPHSPAENGKDGWHVVVDDERRCIWLMHDNAPDHWTRIGWDNVKFLRYWPKGKDLA